MKKNPKRKIGIILGIVAGVLLIAGLFMLNYALGGIGNFIKSKVNKVSSITEDEISGSEENQEIELIENITENVDEDNLKESEEESIEEIIEPEIVRVPNPYSEYFNQNEYMAAWINIPDTVIDYPVMYTPFDENYYLNRGFDNNSNANGCLILDTDSSLDPLSTNLIIHGHNMKSGAMFGTLSKYEDEKYCKEHQYIYLHDEDREHKYQVLCVFRSRVFYKYETDFKFYKFFNATNQEEFDDFYNNIIDLAEFDTGVTAEFGDNFITLSTCAYHVQNGRLVVVAKEIESDVYYEPCRSK